jgi:transposase
MSILYLGVDVAKQTLDAAVCLRGESEGMTIGCFDNKTSGFGKLARKVSRLRKKHKAEEVHLVAEPTGGYELALVAYAHERGWSVSLPNPKKVRDWAGGIGMRAKTDKQDALLLARYGAALQPEPQAPIPVPVQELESLLSRREDLKKLLRAEKNRLGNLQQRPNTPQAVLQSVQRVITTLEGEQKEIDAAIEELINQDPDLKDKARKLRTIPGVGPVNVLPLLVMLVRWDLLTHGQGTSRELTAYIGLDPRHYQSGQTIFKRATISRMGNRTMRHFLYMGALGGVRGQNPLRSFYEGLVDRGKAKKLALVASARKILVWSWAIFQQDTVFDPERVAPISIKTA